MDNGLAQSSGREIRRHDLKLLRRQHAQQHDSKVAHGAWQVMVLERVEQSALGTDINLDAGNVEQLRLQARLALGALEQVLRDLLIGAGRFGANHLKHALGAEKHAWQVVAGDGAQIVLYGIMGAGSINNSADVTILSFKLPVPIIPWEILAMI